MSVYSLYEDGLGVKRTLTYDCDEPDYQYGTYGYSDGKENIGYFFSADVDLCNPTNPQSKPYPLSMIYAGFGSDHGHTDKCEDEQDEDCEVDHSVARLVDEMPGVMNRADLQLSDTSSEYTESSSSCSPSSSSSTLEISSPSSEDSLFEVPVKKQRASRRKPRQSRKFYLYESNGSPLPVESPSSFLAEPQIVTREPRFEGDLYTPRFQRGAGEAKEGFCGLCSPGIWLRIKQSSYWYHMNYHHGISASTGRPYEAPVDFHVERISRTEDDNSADVEGDGVAVLRISGNCGHCGQSVTISNKYLEGEQKDYKGCLDDLIDLSTVNLMSWYKHAQRCHRKTTQD